MKHIQTLKALIIFGLTISLQGCKSVTQQATTQTAAVNSQTELPKVIRITQPRMVTATYSSYDAENSKFFKSVYVDYPIVQGTFVGDYNLATEQTNKKIYTYRGPTKVTMRTATGMVEETVTGTVFLRRKDFPGAITTDQLCYKLPLAEPMKPAVKKSLNRIRPEPSGASASGSFAAVAIAAATNAALSAETPSDFVTFYGDENQDFRKNYYGKDVRATEEVLFEFE